MAKSTVLATRVASEGAAAARDSNPISLSDALRAYLGEVGRPGTSTIKTLDDAERVLRQHQDAEAASRVMQGWVLANVMAMGEESLRELATRVAMNRETVRQLVGYFRLFDAIPDLQSVRTCAHLEFTVAREVAKWSREDQLAFVSGKAVRGITVTQAKELTSREFIQATRDPDLVKAAKKIAGLEADKEGLEEEVKALKGAIKHRYASLKMPDFAAHTRQESVALTEQMMLGVTTLEDLLQQRLTADKEAQLHPEWAARAAGTMYHSLRSVQARIEALLLGIQEQFGKPVTGKIDFEHRLTEGELLIAKDSFDVILSRHQAEAHNREADRQRAKGQRGRPLQKKAVV